MRDNWSHAFRHATKLYDASPSGITAVMMHFAYGQAKFAEMLFYSSLRKEPSMGYVSAIVPTPRKATHGTMR